MVDATMNQESTPRHAVPRLAPGGDATALRALVLGGFIVALWFGCERTLAAGASLAAYLAVTTLVLAKIPAASPPISERPNPPASEPPGPDETVPESGAAAGSSILSSALFEAWQEAGDGLLAAARQAGERQRRLVGGRSDQDALLGALGSAVDRLASTAARIAEQAACQVASTLAAEQSGEHGEAAVDAAVIGLTEVQERIARIKECGDTLSERSREMYRLLAAVTEVANETHLLSLNASIEASSGGELRRRFVAVADEVRALADRAHRTAESVRTLLGGFFEAIAATGAQTESARSDAASVLGRAAAAAAAIRDLRAAAMDTSQAAHVISAVAEQQAAAVAEVADTVRDGRQVARDLGVALGALDESVQSSARRATDIRAELHRSDVWSAGAWARQARELAKDCESLLRDTPALADLTLQRWLRAHPEIESLAAHSRAGDLLFEIEAAAAVQGSGAGRAQAGPTQSVAVRGDAGDFAIELRVSLTTARGPGGTRSGGNA